jgi:exosortase E/protease (VPEID-CTERM system)
MSFVSAARSSALSPRLVLLGIAILLLIEFAVIGLVFQRLDDVQCLATRSRGLCLDDFQCRANWPIGLCEVLPGALVPGYGVLGALTLFLMLFPVVLRPEQAATRAPLQPLALNMVGVVLALLPVLFLRNGAGGAATILPFVLWGLAVPVILTGALLMLAPVSHWRNVSVSYGPALLVCAVVGAAVPTLAMEARPLWTLNWLSEATFFAVRDVLLWLGYPALTDPATKTIGAGDFFVRVEAPCSGVEGIALVTLFVTIYLVLFRRDMRFPLALILYPLGLMASVLFNIARITLLIAIGIEGNPDLAVGGFHSHAGWLTFTLVALGVVALAETVPQLKRATVPQTARPACSDLPPLWRDPVAARILPFAVFMLSALLVSTLSQTPGMHYPLRIAAVATVLAVFWPLYRMLPWRLDPFAVTAGALVGLVWVLVPVPPSEAPPYGALAGTALLLWYVVRGIGTVLVVPVLEELFFRDYLESRLRLRAGMLWSVLAALVSASLFAALHDRWIEAFFAGLVLSAIARRRGNITDAILAHAVANMIVFAVALASGNLALI